RKIAIMEIFETIAGTVWIAAILYVFVNEALQVSEEWWGFIIGSFFLGLIIGSIYCIKYAYLVERNLGKIIFISSLCSFIVTILFGVISDQLFALLFSLVMGFYEQIQQLL